jgi:Tol biopolymer transport system component
MTHAARHRNALVRSSAVLLFLAGSILFPGRGTAQFYNGSQLTFGKSRVQYNDFFWTYYRYDKFDTYFYLNGKELAIYAAEYADTHIHEIELQLQSALDAKIQFIIFNNLSDLKQSNIGLSGDWEYYNTGGVTRIVGGKVMLFFDGNLQHFEEQIRAGISTVILNQMMFGSGVGAQIKNNAIFTMPEWYFTGLISYISKGWNTEIDNYVRDAVVSGNYDKFSRISGMNATFAGHSLWHYIAMTYGESAIPNIVYMSRLSRNIEKGFTYVLSIEFSTLIKNWLEYYKTLYSTQDANRDAPQGDPLNMRKKADRTYTNLKISPDGRNVAYSYQDLGVYKVFIQDLQTGKKKRVFRGGYRLAERPDFSFPLLAWHPNGNVLAILIERKGEPFLYLYDKTAKRFEKQILYNFQKILDISYSDDGLLLAMSAYQKGQSDIFVYNIASGSHEQLTNDQYNDLYPRFVDRGKEIIFSSNRPGDTLRFYEKAVPGQLSQNNDIFVYNYRSKSPLLKRITATPMADEVQPMSWSGSYYCYLSNQNGIYNRFLARFDSAISYIDTATHYRYFTTAFPLTNSSRSILKQDVSEMGGRTGEILYLNGRDLLFTGDIVRPEKAAAAQLEPTGYMEQKRQAAEKAAAQKLADSTAKAAGLRSKPGSRHFSSVRIGDVIGEIRKNIPVDTLFTPAGQGQQPSPQGRGVVITTAEVVKPSPGDSLSKYEKAKQLNYNVEFSVDQTVTQIDFNYLNSSYQPFTGAGDPIFINPGLNLLFMVGITDLMEDYRLSGGVRLNFDLVNNEYLLSYSSFKRRVDHQIVFHRQGVDDYDYYSYVRHKINELHYIVTYPFTPVLSIKGTASIRYDRAIYLGTDPVNLHEPDQHIVWGVLKGELTYDNTRSLGLNLFQGTRYKLFGEYYQLLKTPGNNVFILGLDIRNYQRVHRSMIWANRFAASTSFGTNKLLYYMGGVDNWLWPGFDPNTPVAINQDYVFQSLATNMRGFNQNIRNGNSFFVLNSELRVPIFRYLFNRPIRSGFLNNFQIVAFGDIGTAWTGPTPYSEKNQLFTYYIYRKPLYIEVQMLKDPLVGGFGTGIRSKILGYFIRGDVAWGIEDGKIRTPIFYLSLSLDF